MHCQEGAALRDTKGCQWPEPAPKQVRPGASSQAGSSKHSTQLGKYNEPFCIFKRPVVCLFSHSGTGHLVSQNRRCCCTIDWKQMQAFKGRICSILQSWRCSLVILCRPSSSLLGQGCEDVCAGDHAHKLGIVVHNRNAVDLVLEHEASGIGHLVGGLGGDGRGGHNVLHRCAVASPLQVLLGQHAHLQQQGAGLVGVAGKSCSDKVLLSSCAMSCRRRAASGNLGEVGLPGSERDKCC